MSIEQEKMIVEALPSLYPLQEFEEKAIQTVLEALPPAQPEPLQPWEVLAAQAVLSQPEITHEQAVAYLQSTGWLQEHDRQMMLDGVHRLTAQPEPHWIPVTERMPEEHEWLGTKRFGTTKSDEVYVTFENPKGERFCKHLSFQNGKLSAFDQSTIDAFFKGSRPVAWKPMPEPFKGVNV